MTTPSWTERTVGDPAVTSEDQDAYKLLSASAAKGVAVASALYRGWDNAVTVTDYLSVSYDPPTMLLSLYGLSRMAEAVAETGRWGLSILASDQRPVADALGEEGRPLVGLLGQIPHFRREAGAPALVSGALTWFELRTIAMHEAATHLLFVGEVVAMGAAGATDQAPLVRFQSGYPRTQQPGS